MHPSSKQKLAKKIYTLQKKFLFAKDPEQVHDKFLKLGKFLGSRNYTKKIISSLFNYQNPSLEQKILGIKFRNPVGLSGGFDKDAELISIMEDVGFGFVEIGSVTAKPYKGNPGKRLDRLIEKKGLWVNYGLKSSGAKAVAKSLKGKKFKIPFGINIAKTNCKETADPEAGANDYIETLKIMSDLGDYYTINISCPNAFGGQPFSDPKLLENLLKKIDKIKIKKPVFIKLSPDLDKKTVDKLISISKKHKVDGFICTNLTKKKTEKTGGYSGKIVEKKANALLSHVYKKTRSSKKKYILIGVGGIFSTEDAYKKIKLGANLVQLITGMIYQGPSLIGEINHGLVHLLKKDGYKNISEAVGKANK
jgi:dihydroorotate dehydrogenase